MHRRRALDDEMLEQLEELLITADMGVDTAMRVTANMAEGRYGRRLIECGRDQGASGDRDRADHGTGGPPPAALSEETAGGAGRRRQRLGQDHDDRQARQPVPAAGKKVVIAAGDTFRAAAVEQLQVWGERAGVPVLTAPEGSDPASLAFDAMAKAEADGADLLMIDTAGRLQNRPT
jgi:fused signal recognition particle receptor